MSKIQDGEHHLAEAAKCLKTSLLKWKPDIDIAAIEYEKAANCFKTVKALDRSLECFFKAAAAYTQSNQLFAAAKCYEQASILLFKDLNRENEALEYIEKACLQFREAGTPDTASLTYDRAAKMIESKFPEKSAHFYNLASETTMIEDRPYHACEYLNKSAKISIKLENYKEAIETLKKAINLLQNSGNDISNRKYVICIILLQLKLDDVVSATKTFQKWDSFLDSEQKHIISRIIQSFDVLDSKAIVESLDISFIKNLDIEYVKLSKSIQDIHQEKLKKFNEKKSNEETSYDDLEEGILL